ncbi:MAG: maleylacetoacetate isomerase [Gemmobacter sp.]
MTVTLYDYWRSSAAYRLRIALALRGIAHGRVPVNLLSGEHKGAAHLARNPQGLVPVLEIDGMTLTQSLAILEYLEETRGRMLLPPDPAGRARVRAIAQAIAIDIHPVCNLSVARHAIAVSGGAVTMEGWMQRFIAPGLAAVERMLDHPATGTWCHGDAPTMADVCLIPQVYNARRWGVPLEATPRIAAIADHAAGHAGFAAAHPDRVNPEEPAP